MKTEQEVRAKIKKIEETYKHVLTGSLATVAINAPRALEQVAAESRLHALYWVVDEQFKSKLKGVDR